MLMFLMLWILCSVFWSWGTIRQLNPKRPRQQPQDDPMTTLTHTQTQASWRLYVTANIHEQNLRPLKTHVLCPSRLCGCCSLHDFFFCDFMFTSHPVSGSLNLLLVISSLFVIILCHFINSLFSFLHHTISLHPSLISFLVFRVTLWSILFLLL